MTEHEKVRERQLKFRIICDTIGYDDLKNWSDYYGGYRGYKCDMSEKDMIFTTEFMDKFKSKFYHEDNADNWKSNMYWQKQLIEKHLDDPVSYLYNLLGGPTNK